MARHVIALASELPVGARKRVMLEGKPVLVLNIKGELFALSDTCPHRGASLAEGILTGHVVATEPGTYVYSREGEILRCPWHAWEFDVRTGRSWCDPKHIRLMQHTVSVELGASLLERGCVSASEAPVKERGCVSASEAPLREGPYQATTFPVRVENAYIVIDTPD
jgi:nitrite reductase/ring-hydroxylating ferredoxin subunit